MIPLLAEGVAQAALPCSWTLALPALAFGFTHPRWRSLTALALAAAAAAWLRVGGVWAPPLWVAGAALVGGALLWWRRGPGIPAALGLGAGSGLSWQPCVGAALGEVLNLAQRDPLAALGGLATFVIAVVATAAAVGYALGFLRTIRTRVGDRAAAVPVVVLGMVMVVGWYGAAASVFARWSVAWWG